MKQDLFFINDIIHTYDGVKNNERVMVSLFKVQDDTYANEHNIVSELYHMSRQQLLVLNIKESNFVYKVEGKEPLLEKANTDPRAKREVFINNIHRGQLIKKYALEANRTDLDNVEQVYSYHVNVGHGNCSIIVIITKNKSEIWVVDFSQFDLCNKINYRDNIIECFNFIKIKHNLNEIKIDKLLITHPHYDHINGIEYLATNNCLLNTEVWVNFHYSWPAGYYSRLLQKFKKMNLTFIEPKVSNSGAQVEILYPDNRILRTPPRSAQPHSPYSIVPKHKINNASVIYKLNLGNKSMVFPGDLEEEGWNEVVNCYPTLKEARFYCISHHGSITGHKRTNCPNISCITSIEKCCLDKNINILMGRDGAYPGIFSTEVLKSFKDRIYRTDLDMSNNEPKFLELNWQDENVVYY